MPNDFVSAFSGAFSAPEMPDRDSDFSSSMPMGGGRGFSRVGPGEAGKVAGAMKYDFLVRRRVFLVYRPWERCQRCLDDVAANVVTPPAVGDHQCPHNELGPYEEVVNKILDGSFLFGSESEIANKDGSVAVSLRWYEPKPRSKKERSDGGQDP